MIKGAEISKCTKYRYSLWRIWDESKAYVIFIGLNPSTADAVEDDPTIRRCIKFAESWGFGGIHMMNLFAYRSPEPKKMKQAIDPIGPENDRWLQTLSEKTNTVIAAWGNHGTFKNRSQEVMKLLPNLHYLKLNSSGEPSHPLYLKADLKPIKY